MKQRQKRLLVISVVVVALGLCLLLAGKALLRHAFALSMIEDDLGLRFPYGAKCIRFHYKPPIDPAVCAKIEIPPDAEELMTTRLAAFTNNTEFTINIGREHSWWQPDRSNAVISKAVSVGNWYVLAYLIREHGKTVLYLCYLTV